MTDFGLLQRRCTHRIPAGRRSSSIRAISFGLWKPQRLHNLTHSDTIFLICVYRKQTSALERTRSMFRVRPTTPQVAQDADVNKTARRAKGVYESKLSRFIIITSQVPLQEPFEEKGNKGV